jgi:demethylmenaquinone methyltransferase/2-methoxy-6-polyprenyl-1,4-benzoquinol methylase
MREQELPFVQGMFDAIAPRYDVLNRALSMRRDVAWRRALVETLPQKAPLRILDAACGTGDVLLLAARKRPGAMVTGLDFSERMLALAREKAARAGLLERVRLVSGDALAPPFSPESFDAVTMAFGIRNIMDKPRLLSVFHRLLKPGGTLAVLELTMPGTEPFRSLYLAYFGKILPRAGRLVSRHRNAYDYLHDSVLNFPQNPEVLAMFRKAGFMETRALPLTLGVATLFSAKNPVGHCYPERNHA